METMGRLLGGVAHDFANLVTLISGYSEILLSRIGENDPLRPELEEIHNAANRGARLTSQLLGYTRGQVPQPKAVDLNEIVVGMERMLHPIIGEHVEFRTILDPALRHVFADAGQMEQVLMNLILNARDAVPMGGCITVETTNRELGAAGSGGALPPGAYATVSISDTGRGIDPQSLDRIFEPFFTTKPEGKGTGLGLNIALNIVKEAGGAIRVSSTPGAELISWSIFRVRLWRPQAAEAPAARLPAPGGSETILLVEDDEGVRRLLATMLARRGFRVLDAAGPREALDLFAAARRRDCPGPDRHGDARDERPRTGHAASGGTAGAEGSLHVRLYQRCAGRHRRAPPRHGLPAKALASRHAGRQDPRDARFPIPTV